VTKPPVPPVGKPPVPPLPPVPKATHCDETHASPTAQSMLLRHPTQTYVTGSQTVPAGQARETEHVVRLPQAFSMHIVPVGQSESRTHSTQRDDVGSQT
jgi:hypothetical protein